jgi:phosphatidylserine/phosphatidylglycerophosphate/cardiolipin synthase-like enzyme
MSHDSPFLRRIVKVAVEITSPAIEQFCDDLERLPTGFGQAELAALVDGFAQPEVRAALSSLLGEWRQQGRDATPRELAWALRAANSADEFHRHRQRLEMVWSGPLSAGSTFRRTDQALLELIQTAKRSITVVTFAAYKIPAIAAALVDAAKRGVMISLILESTEESEGAVTFNAIEAMGTELARAATVYGWPMEKRGMDSNGNRGALHLKCAVVDDEAVLISSANLTEHAMNLNMELGLLIRGGEIPRSLAGHLQSLIQGGVLTQIGVVLAGSNLGKHPYNL